jgi:DNA processing protein
MKVNSLKLNDPNYPLVLKNISQAPKELFYIGAPLSSWIDRPRVAIVGSRRISPYGSWVTTKLAAELARAGIVIVSGLAYGVDGAAHRATIEAGGTAVAVLGTGLDRIYPAGHQPLARQIIEQGGTIISEYENTVPYSQGIFIKRNRIISGLADILLITEAAARSGTLSTARFALEQGKTVMVVPGNINSPGSEGCNNLIKSGAIPVTSVDDIFFALNLKPAEQKTKKFHGTAHEQLVIELLQSGVSAQEELAEASKLNGASVSSTLTSLELSGHIKPLGAGNWTLS